MTNEATKPRTMRRAVCENCASFTICQPHTELNSAPEIKKLTEGLVFCSRQCFIRFRNDAIKFVNNKHPYKETTK